MQPHVTTNIETRETHDLIASDKVEGTNVYDLKGEKIGSIKRVMIDKRGGKVGYAVMSFGGFLGLGESYYPLPWSLLTYDERLGGYVVDINAEQLKNAPRYEDEDTFDLDDVEGRKVYDYYNVPPYWM